MRRTWLLVVFLCYLACSSTTSASSGAAVIQTNATAGNETKCDVDAAYRRIWSQIETFWVENPHYRPPLAYGKDVNVTMVWWITALEHVNELKNQIVIAGGMDLSTFFHPSLKWDPVLHCGRKSVELDNTHSHKLWWPTTRSANIIKQERQYEPDSLILHEGIIDLDIWGFSSTIFRCEFNPHYYPFDTQVCEWRLQLKIPEDQQIHLNQTSCVFWLYEDHHPTWQLLACDGSWERKNDFIFVHWRLLMRRHASYAVTTAIAPTLLLANCNPVIFILPAQLPQKGTIGMSFLLAFFIYLAAIKMQLPEASSEKQPIFYVYLILILVFNGLAIIFSTFLPGVKDEALRNKMNRIALIVMTICELFVSFVFLMVILNAPAADCEEGDLTCTWMGEKIGSDIPPIWY